jgi:hypothetical protein
VLAAVATHWWSGWSAQGHLLHAGRHLLSTKGSRHARGPWGPAHGPRRPRRAHHTPTWGSIRHCCHARLHTILPCWWSRANEGDNRLSRQDIRQGLSCMCRRTAEAEVQLTLPRHPPSCMGLKVSLSKCKNVLKQQPISLVSDKTKHNRKTAALVTRP